VVALEDNINEQLEERTMFPIAPEIRALSSVEWWTFHQAWPFNEVNDVTYGVCMYRVSFSPGPASR
jgi:hypothetical protein